MTDPAVFCLKEWHLLDSLGDMTSGSSLTAKHQAYTHALIKKPQTHSDCLQAEGNTLIGKQAVNALKEHFAQAGYIEVSEEKENAMREELEAMYNIPE